MPDYFWIQTFTAADDRQATRLGREWGGTCAAEYNTRNPIVVPVDGELRDRYAEAILRAGDGESVGPHSAATAVLAVRDTEIERLRGELANRDALLEKHRETVSVVVGQREEAKAAIERARQIHQPEQHSDDAHPWCEYCTGSEGDVVGWPCPTIRALEADQ